MKKLTFLLCLIPGFAFAQQAEESRLSTEASAPLATYQGDADRGRLVFGACRTCHYPEQAMGHNNGPNLSGIFGRVVGKAPGFDGYSQAFRDASFVWTPALLNAWMANPMGMFPETTMMSVGVDDPQSRADLIEYLKEATTRDN